MIGVCRGSTPVASSTSAPAARKANDGSLQVRGEPVGIGAEAQQVVAAGDQAHQVRTGGQRDRHLLGQHLGQQPAADGEVRVLDAAPDGAAAAR